MDLVQILILALIQGAAELLPVSSSAHVIVAEKLMGLDPSAPELTFLLVMLHTGTMFAVMLYFWPRWKRLKLDFLKGVVAATAVTGVVGLSLKKVIEKVILEGMLGESHAEIESLFKSLPLVGAALFCAGILIIIAGSKKVQEEKDVIPPKSSIVIGLVQGLCLPFRGFSRSGATISTGILSGISRATAEDFSFALAVMITPPVILLEAHRLMKGVETATHPVAWMQLFLPGLLGMVFSFGAGLLALRWLSKWLEVGRWKYFGFYCMVASIAVFLVQHYQF